MLSFNNNFPITWRGQQSGGGEWTGPTVGKCVGVHANAWKEHDCENKHASFVCESYISTNSTVDIRAGRPNRVRPITSNLFLAQRWPL